MAFDFKKEYKEFYMPKNKPAIVRVITGLKDTSIMWFRRWRDSGGRMEL